jgi:hypothetical protein
VCGSAAGPSSRTRSAPARAAERRLRAGPSGLRAEWIAAERARAKGAASGSRSTGSGGCCVGSGSTRRQAAGARGSPPRPLRTAPLAPLTAPLEASCGRTRPARLLFHWPPVREPSCTPPSATPAATAGPCLPPGPASRAGRLHARGGLDRQPLGVPRRSSPSPSSASVPASASSAPAADRGWHVERLELTLLEERWRPPFARALARARLTALERDVDDYLAYDNTDRAHTGRITRARVPAGLPWPQDGSRPMKVSRRPRVSAGRSRSGGTRGPGPPRPRAPRRRAARRP